MYNIAKDSLFQPRRLLDYRNKSGWFTTFYLLVLTLLVSLGAIIHYGWYQNNTVITTETTGCSLTVSGLTCSGTVYDSHNKFHLYGYSVHFLRTGAAAETIVEDMDSRSLVFQDKMMYLYISGQREAEFPVFSQFAGSVSFDRFFESMRTGLLIGLLGFHMLGNVALLLLIGLISTFPFIRLKKHIRYKTIFKLVIFALTPIALLMTFYNLLEFSDIIFFILMFFCYRSLYLLQRELHFQTMIHLQDAATIGEAEFKIIDDDDPDDDDEDGEKDN